jgi:hypothetical protein
MTGTNVLVRPELTLPDTEAAVLRAAYAGAASILEYGSGGSTVMAAEMPGKAIWSVESDPVWAQMMRNWFTVNPPAAGSEVDIIWSDIGPTKEWGHPVGHSECQRFARYPLEVWDLSGFIPPDVVLVDGRFRAGCVLATAFRTSRLVTVFVDDYTSRPQNHVIETFVGAPVATIGRMVQFDITPMAVPADRLLKIIQLMQRP